MLSARYSPVAVQAEITGKGQPDLQSFNHRKAVAGDNECRQKSYPLGDPDANLSIIPGEMLVARRSRNTGVMGQQEAVFSSVAGLYLGDHLSLDQIMRDYYFVGVAKSEYLLGGDQFGTESLDHGIGFLRAGSMSTLNTCTEDVHAGDLLAWRFPPSNVWPENNGSNLAGVDNGLNPLRIRKMRGMPIGKPLIQLEKFNPTDFSFQLEAAYELFQKPYSQGGVRDLTLKDLTDPKKRLTALQEEAIGWSRGILSIFAIAAYMGAETEAEKEENKKIAEEVLSGELAKDRLDVLEYIFFKNGSNKQIIQKIENDNTLKQLAENGLSGLCGAIGGAWNAKASRIVGKAMGNAKAGNTIDVMWSHFKIGF